MTKLWVDVINPSHALFFNSLLSEFQKDDYFVTLRSRAETVELARMLGIEGEVIGADSKDPIAKAYQMIERTIKLYLKLDNYDYALSFENGSSVSVSRAHKRKSILMCDNDLKFLQSRYIFQSVETYLKKKADYTVVPEACAEAFKRFASASEVITFPGLKEDIYIADYVPDPNFDSKIPFDHFVVIRPEALGSFYVNNKKSLVPQLLRLFNKENINVVYLPRDKGDTIYISESEVFIPPTAINGLDLCYYADAVLTGSGTMAREAACMSKKAISFFPSTTLLSVDKQLTSEGKVLHSRDPMEIIDYVLTGQGFNAKLHNEKSKDVKSSLVRIIKNITSGG